jgi:hypothetical protein
VPPTKKKPAANRRMYLITLKILNRGGEPAYPRPWVPSSATANKNKLINNQYMDEISIS